MVARTCGALLIRRQNGVATRAMLVWELFAPSGSVVFRGESGKEENEERNRK